MSDNLPSLPEPWIHDSEEAGTNCEGEPIYHDIPLFTPDQMHAYAASAVAERDAEIERMKAEVEDLRRWKSTHAPRLDAIEPMLAAWQIEAAAGKEARASLESERAANAILTAEIEALRADAEKHYAAGWIAAAKWAERDDLISDIDSPSYVADRDAAIDRARGQA